MTALFFKLLEMSITGSVVILVTILVRFLLRKRSKWFIMILWTVAAVRLLLPVNIQSVLSVYNFLPFSYHRIVTDAQYKDARLPDYHTTECDYAALMQLSPEIVEQDREIQTAKNIVTYTWVAGMSGIAGYYFVRYMMLRRKLKGASRIDENIYESDKVSSPFVFGLLEPKIYLPSVLTNTERECILKHEMTHISHLDWISKMIGMTIVCVHWYNPFVWLGYSLFEQDIEMRCDESAVRYMDPELRKAYAMSIVTYAKKSNNRSYLVTPLGFSKGSLSKTVVANRIRNLVDHKQGTLRTTVSITLVMLLVAASLGFDAKATVLSDLDYYSEDTGLKVIFSDGYYPLNDDAMQVCRAAAEDSAIYPDGVFYRDEDEDWGDAVVCIETYDISGLISDDDDMTYGEFLTYYLRNELGINKFYVIMTEEVLLSGQEYVKYTVSSLDRRECRVEVIYVRRIDDTHFSDIVIDTNAYCTTQDFDNWFVE